MPLLEFIELTGKKLKTFFIPEGVGSRSENLPSALLRENPLRSVKTPSRWRSRTHTDQPLIRLDRMAVDASGNLRIPVAAEFGTVILEKSTDLVNWSTIEEIEFRGGDGTKYNRNQKIQDDPSAYYRIRMK